MNGGMKSGAADSPFDDVDEDVQEDEEVAGEPLEEADQDEAAATESESKLSREDYPLALRRDSVKDERDMVQFFLQGSTQREEDRRKPDLEDLVDEDVSLTDFREAVYLAGLENLEDAEEILEDWGIGI